MSDPRRARLKDIAGDRKRITPEEAAKALGYFVDANVARRMPVPVGDDGLVSVAEIVDWVGKGRAERRRKSQPGPLTIEFDRVDVNAWTMFTCEPWGARTDVGDLELVWFGDKPLAHAPQALTAWVATSADETHQAGAVSAAAAQVLLLRWAGVLVDEPDWGKQVRELDEASLTWLSKAGDALMAGPLSWWERSQISPVINPRWRARQDHIRTDGIGWVLDHEDEIYRDAPPVATPQPITVWPMHDTRSSRWSIGAVATYLGQEPSGVASRRAKGELPEPDGMIGDTPWWHPTTIRRWSEPMRGAGRPAIGDPVQIRMPTELVDAMDAAATAAGTTRSAWLRDLITRELNLP